MNHPVRVLIVCSESSAEPVLPKADHRLQCTVVRGTVSGGAWFARQPPDVIVVSLQSGVAAGARLLEGLRQQSPSLPLLLLTVEVSEELIVLAGQYGVTELLAISVSPWQLAERIVQLAQDRDKSSPVPACRLTETGMLGQSPGIEAVRRAIGQVADTDVTVLLRGESGTGKEIAARCLWNRSRRAQFPFVKVNCAAIPYDLLESELFGYEAGAFTGAVRQKAGKFELAHHGTIFLDEISEMHPLLQAKLLHVLQDGEFCRLGGRQNLSADVRVLAATNVDLEQAVACGRFRCDLFYRLNVVNITLPPLRCRPDDIPLLLEHFCRYYAELYQRPARCFRPAAIECLQRYTWPGNVRELENLAKRLVVMGDERQILLDLESLPARLGIVEKRTAPLEPELPVAMSPRNGQKHEQISWNTSMPDLAAVAPPAVDPARPALRLGEQTLLEIGRQAAQQAEAEAILQALHQTRWNRRQAARLLQVSYKALQNKLKSIRPGDAPLLPAASARPQ